MRFLHRRGLRGCLVTVYRTNGQSVKGTVKRYTRRAITLTKCELDVEGTYVETTSSRIIVPTERIDMVGVEIENAA